MILFLKTILKMFIYRNKFEGDVTVLMNNLPNTIEALYLSENNFHRQPLPDFNRFTDLRIL